MKSTVFVLASVFVASALPVAGAGTWTTSSWDGGFVPAANNILRGKTPDNPSAAANALVNPNNNITITEGSCSYATLTDGDAEAKNKAKTIALPSNCSLSYALGSARTIKEVRIYSTWGDGGRDTLSVASVAAETQGGQTVTLSTGSVSHSGNNNCACATLKMADDTPLCENVVKVTFNFGAQENGYVGYAELEVIVDGAVDLDLSGIIEITAGNDVTTNRTPDDLSIYGPNGGNLTIAGSGVVVTQNVPDVKTMGGINFGSYWPWLDGTVTVENGARLESDTMLFWGSGQGETYRSNHRKLLVRSGGTAVFSPPGGTLHIIGVQNSSYEGAWLVVTGVNSRATLPATVWLSNNSGDPAHGGGLDVLDGGTVELGTLNAGHSGGTLRLNVDGGTLRATGGIYCYRNYNRWTGGTFIFKNCLVETPVFKFTYPASAYCGDTVTFDGAVFRPLGTPVAKFFDGPPAITDRNAKFYVVGNGLIIDAPANSTLEASALLQGAGGFTKRGAGTVVLSAANTYTGTTSVEAGTLNVTGSFAGPLAVAGGEAVFSGAPTLSGLSLALGGTVTVTGVGSDMGAVSDYSGDFVVAGVSEWPKNTPIVSSSTPGFLEKVAASLNAGETVAADLSFVVKDGSVQLVATGLVNGTLTWTGAAGDTLWSRAGNWSGADRAIASGDALVVAAGGASVVDFGEEVVLASAQFDEGIAAHTISAAGALDSLKINGFVKNLSASAQTFDLPVSMGTADFTVHTIGDVTFADGLAAASGIVPSVVKTGEGTLVATGGYGNFSTKLHAGALDLGGTGSATFAQTVGAEPVIAGGTTLRNGMFTYTSEVDGSYLPWEQGAVTIDNATFTAPKLFAGGGSRIENATRRSLVVTNRSSVTITSTPVYIVSRDNGDGVDGSGVPNNTTPVEVKVLDGSSLRLTAPSSDLYVGNWNVYSAARNGRLDVVDSFVSGYNLKLGHRAGKSWLYVTNSVLSFSSSVQICPDANGSTFESNGIEARFANSTVTTGVFRVYATYSGLHYAYFDGATLVSTGAREMFIEKKDGHDKGVITLEPGGLAVDSQNAAIQIAANAGMIGEGGLVKLGAGTLTLASTNTYAGATIVSNGTLRLTGRVAGAIKVANGATLELPLPDQAAVPTVPSLVVEDGGNLAAIALALPEGVMRVDVLRTTGELSIPEQNRDAAGNVFFAKTTAEGCVLQYGKPLGLQILVR